MNVLQASYGIWMVIVGGLLIASLIVRRPVLRRDPVNAHVLCRPAGGPSTQGGAGHSRTMAAQLDRQTDSILAALARTIELERQRIGTAALGHPEESGLYGRHQDAMSFSLPPENPSSIYGRIRPLLKKGCNVQRIARELHLPEAEVTMVIQIYDHQTRPQEADA